MVKASATAKGLAALDRPTITTAMGSADHYFRRRGVSNLACSSVQVCQRCRLAQPIPEGHRVGAQLLAVRPEDCLVIEDSNMGVQSAAAFGARCFRISFPADGQ